MNIFSKKILILLILIGISLSLLLGYMLYNNESNKIKLELKKDLHDKVFSLEREFLLNFETLHSIKGLFIGSNFVSSSEFKTISLDILSRHKDIQALEWIPKVEHKNREAFEKGRKTEFANFEITQILSQGSMIRAKEREIYFPISYIEPFYGNEIALGFDLASNVKRLETLKNSMDLGQLLSTKSIILVQETSKKKAFLTFMPIYKTHSSTIKNKRLNLEGFILGVFRIEDMFNTAMSRVETKGINLLLIDETDEKIDILYSDFITKSKQNTYFTYEKKLMKLGGRDLVLKAFASKVYIEQRRTLTPLFATFFILIFVLFGTLYIFFINKRKELVEKLVKKRTQELDALNKKLSILSRTDTLTNIANRRYFDEYLYSQWNRALRDKTPISLVMIDIDYFKLYNDNYGHPKGDTCLQDVASILKNTLKRDSDLIARYGGEEFIIVLPNTKESLTIANKCLEAILNAKIEHKFSKISNIISISIGATTIVPTSDSQLKAFLQNVDKALYDAKETGRNKVCER